MNKEGSTISETAARFSKSYAVVESQYLQLAIDGLIYDSGLRRNGEVVWYANDTAKRVFSGGLQ